VGSLAAVKGVRDAGVFIVEMFFIWLQNIACVIEPAKGETRVHG
jgi:hypothetical protein